MYLCLLYYRTREDHQLEHNNLTLIPAGSGTLVRGVSAGETFPGDVVDAGVSRKGQHHLWQRYSANAAN